MAELNEVVDKEQAANVTVDGPISAEHIILDAMLPPPNVPVPAIGEDEQETDEDEIVEAAPTPPPMHPPPHHPPSPLNRGMSRQFSVGTFLQDQVRTRGRRTAAAWRKAVDLVSLEHKHFGSSYYMHRSNYAQWMASQSPELHMKRPIIEGDRWRLDKILERKAKSGVQICILLYKNIEMAVNLKSLYTKRILQNLHKNILVLRHPEHISLKSPVLKWSHHEKLICVDQNVAYLGGVDLAFGRWDTHSHHLVDIDRAKQLRKSGRFYRSTSTTEENATYGTRELAHSMQRRKYSFLEKFRMYRLVSTMSTTTPDYQELLAITESPELIEGDRTPYLAFFGRLHDGRLRRALDQIHSTYKKYRPHTLMEDWYQEEWTNLQRHSRRKKTTEEMEILANFVSKTWIGKDYMNFSVKDFARLEKPFEGYSAFF